MQFSGKDVHWYGLQMLGKLLLKITLQVTLNYSKSTISKLHKIFFFSSSFSKLL